MQNKMLVGAIAATLVLIGLFLYTPKKELNTPQGETITSTNSEGVQIINIMARGGFTPRLTRAKAGTPTLLRIATNDTYDCSVSLVIPKLNYRKFMASTGVEEIPISAEQAKGTISGLCSMGMYSFKVVFD